MNYSLSSEFACLEFILSKLKGTVDRKWVSLKGVSFDRLSLKSEAQRILAKSAYLLTILGETFKYVILLGLASQIKIFGETPPNSKSELNITCVAPLGFPRRA
jgi:hypothetical protein